MTPTTEQEFSTHSDEHGCSTGCAEGWKLVSSKGEKPKAVKDKVPMSAASYLKALLRIGKSEEKVVLDEDMGSPPMDKSDKVNRGPDGNNKFGALMSHDEEEDEVFHDAVSEDLPPPAKKAKYNHTVAEDFDDILEEFKKLPPPEYAYSAHEAAHTRINKVSKSQPAPAAPQEYQRVEEVTRPNMSRAAVDYTEFSEDILNKEEDCNSLSLQTNEEIKDASDAALSYLQPDGFECMVAMLPKLYTMNYPVSNYILPELNIKKLIQSSPYYIRQWRAFGTRKNQELLMEEDLYIYQLMESCGMDDEYHCFYEMMEGIYDDWRIPHKFRSLFRMHELSYIGVMINDASCSSDIHRAKTLDKEPKGRIFEIFSKQDTIEVARRKWLCAIKQDYIWFWDILHSSGGASSV